MNYIHKAVAVCFTLMGSFPALADAPTPNATGSAHLTLVAGNTRDDGVTIRGVRMEQFSTPGCTTPTKLTNFFLKKNLSERVGSPVKVPAGKPIGLTFSYSDARYKENRSCALSGEFMPAPGANYVARFSVTPGVQGCSISVLDQASAPAEFTQHPHVCAAGLKEELASGEGYLLKWNLRVKIQAAP